MAITAIDIVQSLFESVDELLIELSAIDHIKGAFCIRNFKQQLDEIHKQYDEMTGVKTPT